MLAYIFIQTTNILKLFCNRGLPTAETVCNALRGNCLRTTCPKATQKELFRAESQRSQRWNKLLNFLPGASLRSPRSLREKAVMANVVKGFLRICWWTVLAAGRPRFNVGWTSHYLDSRATGRTFPLSFCCHFSRTDPLTTLSLNMRRSADRRYVIRQNPRGIVSHTWGKAATESGSGVFGGGGLCSSRCLNESAAPAT
jgi:hypothetical protein